MYVNAYIHSYIHAFMYSYVYSFIHSYIYKYIQTYIHTYLHTYIHTYINTFIDTYINMHDTHTKLLFLNHRKHQTLLISDFGISRQHNTGATSAVAAGNSAGAGFVEGNGYGSAPWSAPETFHISNVKV